MILRGSVFSQVLDMETGLTVITPSEIRRGARPQVAYVLHGLNAANGSWSECSMLPAYAQDYNVVFVMPEVGRSYYFDMRFGQKFFTYVADELPDICAEVFNVSAERADTAVIGASMGGYGALKCALTRPERFGMCCAFSSGSLYLAELVARLQKIGWDKVEPIMGAQRVADYRAMLGPDMTVRPEDELPEVAKKAAGAAEKPLFYAACGTRDPFHKPNLRFRDDMIQLGFNYTYEEWDGEHDWDFFNAALLRGLRFCFGPGEKKVISVFMPQD